MRITQGTFSFLPDFTDEQIEAQMRYAVGNGWALSIEYTDDPHPRNAYWEMWGLPHFDLPDDGVETVMREVRACREAFPEAYVKVLAYDATYGRQTTALSFIVNRPSVEHGFELERYEDHDRRGPVPPRPPARAVADARHRLQRRLAAPIRPRTARERNALRNGAHVAGGSRRGAAGGRARRARARRRAGTARPRPISARRSRRRTSSRCSTSSTASWSRSRR